MTGLSADVLARAQALLEVDDDAAQVEPEPPADSVGAVGAVAYRWPDGAVAAVYAFDSHAAALGARKAHLSALTGEGREHRATANGGLLLSALAPADSPEAVAHITRLRQSFAGRE